MILTVRNTAISGGSRISQMRGANPWGGGENLSFVKIFAENCMKMKEIGQRGGTSLEPPTPLDPPMEI